MAAKKKSIPKKVLKSLIQGSLFDDEVVEEVKESKPEDTPIVTKSKKSMTPFSVLGLAFTDYEAFRRIPDDILSGFYFIINNQMSVQFPMQADCFNLNKISEAQVVRYWGDFLRTRFNSLPKFIFTKGKQKMEEEKKEVNKFTDKVLMDYAVFKDCSIKEVKFALRQRPVQMAQELCEFIDRREMAERLKAESLSSLKVEKDEM